MVGDVRDGGRNYAPLTRVGLQRIGRAGGEALRSIGDVGSAPPP